MSTPSTLWVSKNSGGSATYAKIEAARTLGIPVVMIERPAKPDVAAVEHVDEVLRWLHNLRGALRIEDQR